MLDDDFQQVQSRNLAFTVDHIIHENIRADQCVSIIGYPGDFMDRTTRLPIRRNALIAVPMGMVLRIIPTFSSMHECILGQAEVQS